MKNLRHCGLINPYEVIEFGYQWILLVKRTHSHKGRFTRNAQDIYPWWKLLNEYYSLPRANVNELTIINNNHGCISPDLSWWHVLVAWQFQRCWTGCLYPHKRIAHFRKQLKNNMNGCNFTVPCLWKGLCPLDSMEKNTCSKCRKDICIYIYIYIYICQGTKLRLVTWFCCQLIAKPGNTTATAPWPGGRFKNTYELLNPRALKISMLYKNRIFQCMGKIFCVEFQRFPLKFHTKYLIHRLKDMIFIKYWNFKSS